MGGNTMLVSELIEKLQKLEPNREVLINVRTWTTAFGSAQVTPWEVNQSYGGATIEITLPEGQYIGTRKAK
jgi:hypothetical protein